MKERRGSSPLNLKSNFLTNQVIEIKFKPDNCISRGKIGYDLRMEFSKNSEFFASDIYMARLPSRNAGSSDSFTS